jgi:hypothetical protein
MSMTETASSTILGGWARRGVAALLALVLTGALLSAMPATPVLADCPRDEPDCRDREPERQPPPAGSVFVTDRDSTSLELSFTQPAGASTATLQVETSSGWASLAPRSTTGTSTYAHAGLTPDTRYCYRVSTTKPESRVQNYSATRCAYTLDGRDIAVWRVEARITTADIPDAGNGEDRDGAISVSVAGPIPGAGGLTYLNHARRDFERGDTHGYDLVLTGVHELGDITQITLMNPKDDDWCVESFTLRVNGSAAFQRNYGSTTCRWIGADSASTSIMYRHAELRASTGWQNYTSPSIGELVTRPDGALVARVTFSRSEIEDRIESMVGHSIQDTDAYWGQRYGRHYVEVSKWQDHILRADLDLAADVFGPDPEVDADFDLHASVSQPALGAPIDLDIEMKNFDPSVDFDWWAELLVNLAPCGPVVSVATGEGVPFCLDKVEELIEQGIAGGMPHIAEHFELPGVLRDPSVRVDDNANLVLEAVVQPADDRARLGPPDRPIAGRPDRSVADDG